MGLVVVSRKRLNTVLGLILLAGLVYWLYPFIAGERNMRAFCGGLSFGLSQQDVEKAASDAGYRLTMGKEQSGFVHDQRAFGRFICEVKFADGRLTSARYFNND